MGNIECCFNAHTRAFGLGGRGGCGGGRTTVDVILEKKTARREFELELAVKITRILHGHNADTDS